jgi:hypothetical protein
VALAAAGKATTLPGEPGTVPDTGTGVTCEVVVVPLPSWPLAPAPQQYAAPVAPIAQVKSSPALIWARVTPDSGVPLLAVTATGTLLHVPAPQPVVVAGLPSSPLLLSPQQYASPVVSRAHVWSAPTLIWARLTPDSAPDVVTAVATLAWV